MTEEQKTETQSAAPAVTPHRTTKAQGLSAISASRQRLDAPEVAPAAPPVSAPEATVPPVETPAATQERVEPPVALTGQESDDDLKQLGYDHSSPTTAERIRTLARRAKAAEDENTTLRAAQLVHGQQREQEQVATALNPPPQQQLTEADWKFDESAWVGKHPEPSRDDYDAHRDWKIRRDAVEDAHDVSVQQNQKLATAMAPQLAEARRGEATRRYEAEWEHLAPTMERFGTSRSELETAVLEIVTKNPGHSVKGAAYIYMEHQGILDGDVGTAPVPPSVTVPGQGRVTEPGAEPPSAEPTEADIQSAQVARMRELGQEANRGSGGRMQEARQLSRSLVSSIRQRR